MASAGQATAQRPQATHFSSPFSSRISTCLPRHFGKTGIFSSGELTVIFFLKMCLKVVAKPTMNGRIISGDDIRPTRCEARCAELEVRGSRSEVGHPKVPR